MNIINGLRKLATFILEIAYTECDTKSKRALRTYDTKKIEIERARTKIYQLEESGFDFEAPGAERERAVKKRLDLIDAAQTFQYNKEDYLDMLKRLKE